MTDSDFSPADAEANAAGLRQRLDDLEAWWRDPAPEPVRKAGSRAWSAGYELGRPPPTCPPQEKPLYEPEIGIASAGGSFVA